MSDPDRPLSWSEVTNQFLLDPDYIHLALCMVAPNPVCVRESIEIHRLGFDQNPALYYRNKDLFHSRSLSAIARFLGTFPDQLALTESTTAGVSVVLKSLDLKPGEEVVSSVHEHYSVDMTLNNLVRSTGIRHQRISLYADPAQATRDEIISRLLAAITPLTRVVCLTWVHSCTGVKLPLREIGLEIQRLNTSRSEEERIITVVDGVHGVGVEAFPTIGSLACDFLVSGFHKWLFGPRGTGFIWGSIPGWSRFKFPLIVSFDNEAFLPWRHGTREPPKDDPARVASPGGFPAFEHRWAIQRSIEFMEAIRMERISDRIHSHLLRLHECIRGQPGVTCLTPAEPRLSAGLLCFHVHGVPAGDVVEALLNVGMIAGQTPYPDSCVRLAASIVHSDDAISRAIQILDRYFHERLA